MAVRMTEGEALTLVKCLLGLAEEAEVKDFAIAVHFHETPGQCDGATRVVSNLDAIRSAELLMSGMLTIAMRGGRQDGETDPGAGSDFGRPSLW